MLTGALLLCWRRWLQCPPIPFIRNNLPPIPHFLHFSDFEKVFQNRKDKTVKSLDAFHPHPVEFFHQSHHSLFILVALDDDIHFHKV